MAVLAALVLICVTLGGIKGDRENTECISATNTRIPLRCDHNAQILIYQAYFVMLNTTADCVGYSELGCKTWLPSTTSKFNISCYGKWNCSTWVSLPVDQTVCNSEGNATAAMLHVHYGCFFNNEDTPVTEFDQYPLNTSSQIHSGVRATLRANESNVNPKKFNRSHSCSVESDTDMTLRIDVLQLDRYSLGGYCIRADDWSICATGSLPSINTLTIDMQHGDQQFIHIQPDDPNQEVWALFNIVLTAIGATTTNCGTCPGWMTVSCGLTESVPNDNIGEVRNHSSEFEFCQLPRLCQGDEALSNGIPTYVYIAITLAILLLVVLLVAAFVWKRKRSPNAGTDSLQDRPESETDGYLTPNGDQDQDNKGQTTPIVPPLMDGNGVHRKDASSIRSEHHYATIPDTHRILDECSSSTTDGIDNVTCTTSLDALVAEDDSTSRPHEKEFPTYDFPGKTSVPENGTASIGGSPEEHVYDEVGAASGNAGNDRRTEKDNHGTVGEQISKEHDKDVHRGTATDGDSPMDAHYSTPKSYTRLPTDSLPNDPNRGSPSGLSPEMVEEQAIEYDAPVHKISDELEIVENDIYDREGLQVAGGQQTSTYDVPKQHDSDELEIIENDIYNTSQNKPT